MRWRFRKILRPSQNTWTLTHQVIWIYFWFLQAQVKYQNHLKAFPTYNLFDVMVRKVVKVWWVFKCLSSSLALSFLIIFISRKTELYQQWNHFWIYHKLHILWVGLFIFWGLFTKGQLNSEWISLKMPTKNFSVYYRVE